MDGAPGKALAGHEDGDFFCYVAPQKLGEVNEPVNFNLSAGETARLLERDRPKAYVYDLDVKDMAQRALALSAHKPALVAAVDHRGLRPALPEGLQGSVESGVVQRENHKKRCKGTKN